MSAQGSSTCFNIFFYETYICLYKFDFFLIIINISQSTAGHRPLLLNAILISKNNIDYSSDKTYLPIQYAFAHYLQTKEWQGKHCYLDGQAKPFSIMIRCFTNLEISQIGLVTKEIIIIEEVDNIQHLGNSTLC